MKAKVAWVPTPNRYGGYSEQGVMNDGGHFVKTKAALDRRSAESIAHKLNSESRGSMGGYVVVEVND